MYGASGRGTGGSLGRSLRISVACDVDRLCFEAQRSERSGHAHRLVVEQPTTEGRDEVSDAAFEGMDHAEEHSDGDIETHSFDRPVEESSSAGATEEPPDVEAHGFRPAAGSI
jgi:hypothetical protein